MATRIRLQRHGRKKAPFYHIVVADIRAPRDGKFIERLGYYNPTTVPAQITVDVNKAVDWLQKGAQPTTTVNAILRYKGVLYKKHLLRGVAKGSFTMEVAEQKFEEWVKSHENSVMDKVKAIETSEATKKAAEVARINAKRLDDAAKKAAAEREAEEAAKAETEATVETETEATAETTETETISNDTTEETAADESANDQ